MKYLGFVFFMAMLSGCSHPEVNKQNSNSNALKEQQLKSAREVTKGFLPNPDSAKFRNQMGDCGEVSYNETDNTEIAFQRFVVIDKNIVLLENWVDPKQFELSWKSACTPSWK